MSTKNNYMSCSSVIDVKLTPEDTAELIDAMKMVDSSTPKQLTVEEAIAVAKKNSTLRGKGYYGGWYGMFPNNDRRSDGLHPTRNDVNRHGQPSRKKKGSAKPKKWLK